MTIPEITSTVQAIMEDIFDVFPLQINESTTAGDIEEWDSLSHVQLVFAIEEHFKVKFSSLEIRNWKNVGSICQSIVNHQK